ncbi:Rho GTPase-activating protein 1, partial [Orchesella cincta]
YRAFERKYRKNLKALYLVHPTNFIRLALQVFKPFVSAKFGRKVMYISDLSELNQHIRLDQLCIPNAVDEYDAQLLAKEKKPSAAASNAFQLNSTENGKALLETQQFGVSLAFIKENNGGEVIPPIMKTCLEYIS